MEDGKRYGGEKKAHYINSGGKGFIRDRRASGAVFSPLCNIERSASQWSLVPQGIKREQQQHHHQHCTTKEDKKEENVTL
ncbi:hypothetical protein PoB_007183100 [Plakobranchus ocellatus]|uniref:Uncharacterized protein n=1 Tax=Plakobranchus ocellatus TaxID=259542 RepID=A0AAV4DN05_9GAST|nr:hypothetical protein PoB_007183100 [Plakobranchus ocellatus]